MLVEFLHLVASRAEVFTGVELSGLLSEDFADSRSHSQTAVRVDVDLADIHLGSLAELFLGDTDSVRKLAAVLVDNLDIFLGNRRRTVEHDGEIGELSLNSLKHVESQWRGNEKTGLRVTSALFGSELVSTVRSTNRNSEAVAASAVYEVDNLLRVSVGVVVRANLILNTCEHAELTLDSHVILVCVVHNFLSKRDILLIGEVAAVDHYRREAIVDTVFAKLECIAVVKVKHDFRFFPTEALGILNSALSHIAEKDRVGIVTRTLGYLKDNRRFCVGSSLDDGLELLHVVEVECGDGITAMHCLGKHLFCVDKAKFLVIYHVLSKFFVLCAHFDAKIQKIIHPCKILPPFFYLNLQITPIYTKFAILFISFGILYVFRYSLKRYYFMKIFASNQIHEIDNATCEAQKIDSIELMERAAEALSVEIMTRFLPSQRIVVIAGPGNNGGDALALARILFEQGYKKMEVFLFNVLGKLSHDCEEERKKLIVVDGIDFTEVKHDFQPPYLGKNDVVIDGLFGSGLRQPLQGGFVMLARLINESGAYVISIDIPSGLFGEWNDNVHQRDMIHADLTLSFQTPRLSFFFSENADIVGEWHLLDIDLDDKKMKELPTDFWYMEAQSVRPLFKPRKKFTGKRDFGSVLIIGGSTGMMGAPILSARACLRSGAGLVTVHSSRGGLPIVQSAVPEAMFEPDRQEHYIKDMTIHHAHQAVVVGPGIGTNEATIDALEALLKNAKVPLVIDADALNCISRRPQLLSMIPPHSIITPHIGEFDRLFGEHHSSEARLKKAIDMAKYYNIVIVLKGHHTAVIRPTGRVDFNSTGNPGMATAGSGDVLTGVIAAFLAQSYRPELAATAGVFVHGLAGDFALADKGEYGIMATDIADNCGKAIRAIITRDKI